MRRGAVIAGRGAALLLAVAFSGCAAFRPFHAGERSGRGAARGASLPTAQRSARSQELSQGAQAAIDRHDDAAALALLRELAALEPWSAEANHRLGRVLQSQGRFAEAETAYRRALTLDKEYVGAMIGLGSIDEALGRPADGLTEFDKAIEIDPHQAEAHLERGRALEGLGRTDEALAAYFRTLEFAPNSLQAKLRVATLQLARGEPDQALARLDPLVEQYPDDAEARHQRGRAHLALNHLPQARDDLKLAAIRLPDRPEVHYHLALALAADHETKAAIAAAEHALQLAPNYAEARALSEKLHR
jgi:tetratricopeptide (TPR) repeat protein